MIDWLETSWWNLFLYGFWMMDDWNNERNIQFFGGGVKWRVKEKVGQQRVKVDELLIINLIIQRHVDLDRTINEKYNMCFNYVGA